MIVSMMIVFWRMTNFQPIPKLLYHQASIQPQKSFEDQNLIHVSRARRNTWFEQQYEAKKLRKKAKFWFLFFLGACLLIPVSIFLVITQLFLYAVLYSSCFFFYCYLLYRHIYRRMKPKYPMLPPEGKPDIYTGINIPRPICEDMEQHAWFFNKTRRKRTYRSKKAKKK